MTMAKDHILKNIFEAIIQYIAKICTLAWSIYLLINAFLAIRSTSISLNLKISFTDSQKVLIPFLIERNIFLKNELGRFANFR